MGCNLWFDTDLHSASVNAVVYEIFCYIGLCYESTWLYRAYSLPMRVRYGVNHSVPLQWRHNGHDSISNHQPHDCSDADQRKHQSSVSLAFVWGIHRGPINSPHKWPVTWKMFPFDDVILLGYVTMTSQYSPNLHQFVPLLLCALYFIMKWTVQIIVHVTTTQLLNSEHILAANAWLLIAWNNIGGLVPGRCNSIANALELRLSCTKLSIWVSLGIWITTEKLSVKWVPPKLFHHITVKSLI